MTQNYDNVKVGDMVWYSDVNRSGLITTTVTKVGSKLIHTRSLVFRKDTGRTNDAYEHQTLIVDRDLYEAEQRANKAFAALCKNLNYNVRKSGVTAADIQAAAKLLGIDLEV